MFDCTDTQYTSNKNSVEILNAIYTNTGVYIIQINKLQFRELTSNTNIG